MKLFGGMEKNELLISVGITFIFCGAISYFCYSRIKNIENAVTKQNQVLSSFISNVKNEIQPSLVNETMGGVMHTMASDEAIATVNKLNQHNNDNDSDSDSDDDSGSDSDSDSGSDSDKKNDSGNHVDISNNDYIKTIMNESLMNLGSNIM